MSPEFILKYIEWSKSRVVLLSPTSKRDRGWYEPLPSIWSQWILECVVENDNIPSMRTLAHIYDAIKEITKRYYWQSHARTRKIALKHNIRFTKLIDFFCPQQLTARGLRPTSQPRSAR